MKFLSIVFYLCFPLVSLVAQDTDDEITYDAEQEDIYRSGDEKIGHYWGFNLQVSTDGFLIGGSYHRKIAAYTHLGLSADMFWVKGENEMVDFWGRTLNAENILIIPVTLNLKRRIFAESLTNTFRPFLRAGGGWVYGYYISGDFSRSQLPPDHQRSQNTFTLLGGFGADFGKPGGGGYGMDIRYQILRFPNSLGMRKKFDNLQIGFQMNF